MMSGNDSNPIFRLAADFVNHTSKPVFLTGKAGTGKTTFLHHIRATTRKKTAVVAPTGVAAINAGGVTMHSLFQLPMGPFVPGHWFGETPFRVTDKNALVAQMRFSSAKRDLLKNLELLIIDEVSMLRCDMLDATDQILRAVRKKPDHPFGGVQVLFIGDLYQLPPVVSEEEWNLLGSYYRSPFFFSAKVVEEMPPIYIELQKIYRQKEQQFIDLLNHIRNNEVTSDDLALLNQRYDPFPQESYAEVITLTTHNRKAEFINLSELNKLSGRTWCYEGALSGEFNESILPTDKSLCLKEGAQVMFIKNDSGESRRYFNGKLAVVTALNDDSITVKPLGETDEFELEKETWKNIRFVLNRTDDTIEEDELGSFTQYPVRLAWAITIHKSQGLTFEKAVIDAGRSFAAGQVYVALSRCRSLQGLTLLSEIHPGAIQTNSDVIAYARQAAAHDHLHQLLEEERVKSQRESLLQLFTWTDLADDFRGASEALPGLKLKSAAAARDWLRQLQEATHALNKVSDKFRPQLQELLDSHSPENSEALRTRVQQALKWFIQSIDQTLLLPSHQFLNDQKSKKPARKWVLLIKQVLSSIENKRRKLQLAAYDGVPFLDPESIPQKETPEAGTETKTARKKGESLQETLALFKQGLPATEIAAQRHLAVSTVEEHLARLILSGDIDLADLMPADKIESINDCLTANPDLTLSGIKNLVGDSFSFSEIKAVVNHRRRMEMQP